MKQHVEGYNVHSSYDGPYLPGADFDPDEVFANAGDVEAAGKVQEAMQPAAEPEDSNPSEEPIFDPDEDEDEDVEEVDFEEAVEPEPEDNTPGIKITGVE